jgi:uncharacterized protein YacL
VTPAPESFATTVTVEPAVTVPLAETLVSFEELIGLVTVVTATVGALVALFVAVVVAVLLKESSVAVTVKVIAPLANALTLMPVAVQVVPLTAAV